MKIFLIIFILFTSLFANETKTTKQKTTKQKTSKDKTSIKKKIEKKQTVELEKSAVFKQKEIINFLEIKAIPNEQKYNLNHRYSPAIRYKSDSNYDLDYKFGFDYKLDEETGKLEQVRFDIETKIKGIN